MNSTKTIISNLKVQQTRGQRIADLYKLHKATVDPDGTYGHHIHHLREQLLELRNELLEASQYPDELLMQMALMYRVLEPLEALETVLMAAEEVER